MTKKGADFESWWKLQTSKDAFESIRKALETEIEFSLPDYNAASIDVGPQPLELFVDACDYGWGCTPAQPQESGGVPAPICVFFEEFRFD